VQATDGSFYGTTSSGGAQGNGTLFSISSTGVFRMLHDLTYTEGELPDAPLLQHTNGLLYGTANQGGPGNYGTFFSLDVGLKPFVKFLPSTTQVGTNVQILGQGFTGTTDVSFNGVPAAFSIVYDTYLVATVPVGATSGYITVTTPTGTLNSDKQFVVAP